MLSHRSLIPALVTCHPRETFVMSMKYFNYVMYDLFRRRQKKKTEDKLTIVKIGLKGLLAQLQNFTTKDCSW